MLPEGDKTVLSSERICCTLFFKDMLREYLCSKFTLSGCNLTL